MTTLNPSQTTRAAKKNQLYEACAQRPEHVFSTAELDRLGICGGVQEVAVLCTELLHQNLFRMYRGEGEEVHFQVATKEQAKIISHLPTEEASVYRVISDAHTAGTWSRSIMERTGIPASNVTSYLKKLESKKLIKKVRPANSSKQLCFMRADLDPEEDTTGAVWYSDGELDYLFVNTVRDVVLHHVQDVSWRKGDNIASHKGSNFKSVGENIFPASYDGRYLIPYPAAYADYPVPSDVKTYIDSSGVFINKDITRADMEQLMEMLVYDGQLERMGRRKTVETLGPKRGDTGSGVGDGEADSAAGAAWTHDIEEPMYRWKPRLDGVSSAAQAYGDEGAGAGTMNEYGDTPCIKCANFEICEEGGPVNAEVCRYFDEWLRD